MLINNQKKIAIVVTIPSTARFFLIHQIESLAKLYQVTLISNFSLKEDSLDWLPDNVKTVHIPIRRKIHLLSDACVLCYLMKIFYKSDFKLVHSVSPKAGLLAMMASFFLRIPVRIHTFTGQVWVTRQGIVRVVLKAIDSLISSISNFILIDSHSQKKFLIKHNIVDNLSSCVTGNGSICGVNLNKFKSGLEARKKTRKFLGINNNAFVFLFLGRSNRDKGVIELGAAFYELNKRFKNSILLFVGSDEDNHYADFEKIDGVMTFPETSFPEQYINASDVLCLPSYREGFGHVIIEAAACGVPAIGSDIYGISDAIVNNETGLLVEPKSTIKLKDAMELLMNNSKMRKRMGENAFNRVSTMFSQQLLTDEIINLYANLLNIHDSD